jgi:hypothetical protein
VNREPGITIASNQLRSPAPAFEAAAGSANKSELNEIAVECDNFN